MQDLPLALHALLFSLSAIAIWRAGTSLEGLADSLARRTGLGYAFTGVLLLAGATSLPEVSTTVTAVVLLDNPTLAVHNLLGGVALQTAILVWVDFAKKRSGALTYFSPRFVLLIEGVGLVLLLQIVIVGITSRDASTAGPISIWLCVLAVAYMAFIYLVNRYQGQPRWTPDLSDDFPREVLETEVQNGEDEDSRSLKTVWLLFAGMSLIVLVGGWLAATTAEVLAERTGLGDAFLGATLLALATSLPEVSTTTSAARKGRYTMAISNIFGSNAFDVSLLFVAELLFLEGSVLDQADGTLLFVAGLGGSMTCVYLWGLMERENRTVFGIGWDSAIVGAAYLGGMVVLYFM